ncbi:hypothetical protein CFC21_103260 [Triticum aestivum]|uniref:SAM domain-containing protein n=2 Tax=Triticum aestivum TaxID=4565 RepID=A0A3B6SG55_WHEAT|nr:uncharacterized protein LOC123161738 [Triticum aestivum]KAF7102073.1 hypothetical protein CFC21_103260 [Triticum aestivum]
MNTVLTMSGIDDEEPHSEVHQFMNRPVAMSAMDVKEPPSVVSIDPSRSVNIVDEDDNWVIVKKQRITILIPPLSPAAASPQVGTLKLSSRQVSLPRMSRRNCNAATKKHPKHFSTKKSLEGLGVGINIKKARTCSSEKIVHQDDAKMKGESSRSAAAPVVRSEWTKHADHGVEGLSHQATEKATSPLGNMYDPGLPVISSNVTNKVLRARLLQRRVARFGGLRNWLLTCGLGWFVKILDSEGIGMYQMVSLTMNQLKEMGLIAVGPRRKLIHAIDCLCKPGQFEMFS